MLLIFASLGCRARQETEVRARDGQQMPRDGETKEALAAILDR